MAEQRSSGAPRERSENAVRMAFVNASGSTQRITRKVKAKRAPVDPRPPIRIVADRRRSPPTATARWWASCAAGSAWRPSSIAPGRGLRQAKARRLARPHRPARRPAAAGRVGRAGPGAGLRRRTLALPPAGHGHVGARFDSGFCRIAPLRALRAEGVSFSISAPRSSAMWRTLGTIDENGWEPAVDFPDAEVAETSYTPEGWEHEPLRLVVRRVAFAAEGIATDLRASPAHHPGRAALADRGRRGDTRLRLQLHPQRHARPGGSDRAPPPPPRPDRGADQ